jgi:hypothetical protein
MSSQHPQPTIRKSSEKLTETESPLRREEAKRRQRQWYVDTAVSFKLYRARFMNLLARLNLKNRLPETDPNIASQLSSALAQEIEEWSKLETLLLDIVLPEDLSTRSARAHLPHTGSIPLNKIALSSGYEHEQTTVREDDESFQAVHELARHCQGLIREFYHAQQPKRMPSEIHMGALNYFSLKSLCQDKYFPQTKVLVQLDLSLGDKIICK